MLIAYVVLACLGAAVNLWAAISDFRRTPATVANATRVEVPLSWLPPLGALKMVGAAGLLVGIAVPPIGVAAAVGLVLFFVCAVFAHLRVQWYATLPFPGGFLAIATASLITRLLTL